MKRLILSYSHSGNNKKLSHFIANRYAIDAVDITEIKKRRSMYTTMIDTLFSRRPKIEEITEDLSAYDEILLIAPIWVGKISSPMLSALHRYGSTIQKYRFITISGNPAESEEKNRALLEKMLHKECSGFLGFAIEKLLPEDTKKDPQNLMKFVLTDEQLECFIPQLDTMLK